MHFFAFQLISLNSQHAFPMYGKHLSLLEAFIQWITSELKTIVLYLALCVENIKQTNVNSVHSKDDILIHESCCLLCIVVAAQLSQCIHGCYLSSLLLKRILNIEWHFFLFLIIQRNVARFQSSDSSYVRLTMEMPTTFIFSHNVINRVSNRIHSSSFSAFGQRWMCLQAWRSPV